MRNLYIAFALSIGIGAGLCAPEQRIVNKFDVTRRLQDHFNSNAPFALSRHPVRAMRSAELMRIYIIQQLELLQTLASQRRIRTTIEKDSYMTEVHNEKTKYDVNATNVLFIMHSSENATQKDEPLMLTANYDTDDYGNFVNEGSGVVALLVLAEMLIQELTPNQDTDQPRGVIQHSLIFAFTDVALKKYGDPQTPRGVTGATHIATDWLPKFLMDRKAFRGAIVLDNIMNYNPEARSQIVENLGIDRAFNLAYIQMAEKEFAGDFLGIIHRDDHLDTPIVEQLEDAWKTVLFEPKDAGSSSIDPRLIRFTFATDLSTITKAVQDFLHLEQSAFWNHHIQRTVKLYPAVTLTDTRIYRKTTCGNMCNVPAMTTEGNLAFMKRTVNALKRVVVDRQIRDKNGALPTVHGSSIFLAFSVILGYVTSRALL